MAPNPPTHGANIGKIIIWIIAVVAALVILAWVYNFYNQNIRGNSGPKASPSPSAVGPLNLTSSPTKSTENAAGNWTLAMNSQTTSEMTATKIDTRSTGTIEVNLPASGSFSASGDWSGNGSGTSGPSTVTGTSAGKLQIAGEVKNGKVHYNVTYTYTACETTIVTPIGTQVDRNCPAPITDHAIDIDFRSGATATHQITGAAVTGTENWTLTKK